MIVALFLDPPLYHDEKGEPGDKTSGLVDI